MSNSNKKSGGKTKPVEVEPQQGSSNWGASGDADPLALCNQKKGSTSLLRYMRVSKGASRRARRRNRCSSKHKQWYKFEEDDNNWRNEPITPLFDEKVLYLDLAEIMASVVRISEECSINYLRLLQENLMRWENCLKNSRGVPHDQIVKKLQSVETNSANFTMQRILYIITKWEEERNNVEVTDAIQEQESGNSETVIAENAGYETGSESDPDSEPEPRCSEAEAVEESIKSIQSDESESEQDEIKTVTIILIYPNQDGNEIPEKMEIAQEKHKIHEMTRESERETKNSIASLNISNSGKTKRDCLPRPPPTVGLTMITRATLVDISTYVFHPILGKMNSYFNWIRSEDIRKLNAGEVEVLLFDLYYKLVDNRLTCMKYGGMKIVADRLCYVFLSCLLFTEEFDMSKPVARYLLDTLKVLKMCHKHGYIQESLTVGIAYVLHTLEIFIKFKKTGEIPDGSYMEDFEDFDSEIEAGALAIKFYFFGLLYKYHFCPMDLPIHAAEKLIELIPGISEWHLCRYKILRRDRRTQQHGLGPNAQEKEEIHNAVSINPRHPYVILCVCIYLSDIITNRKIMLDWDHELKVGDWTFVSIAGIAHFIKLQSEAILSTQYSVSWCLKLGRLHFLHLPQECADLAFGESCIRSAFSTQPRSSMVNHYMGLHYLSAFQSDGLNAEFINAKALALQHFQCATKYDPRNFPAKLDLLRLQISDAMTEKKAKEISTLLHEEICEASWSSERVGKLLYLKGSLEFILGDSVDAWNFWLECYMTHKSALDFKNLENVIAKYDWPSDRINILKVKVSLMSSHLVRNLMRYGTLSVKEAVIRIKGIVNELA